MTSKNMSKKESKSELLKKIRLELFNKKQSKVIPGKTFTSLNDKLLSLEFGGKNNLKSIENFYNEKIAPLNKEINTKEKLNEKKKQLKEDTNEFFNAVESSGIIKPTSKKSNDERKQNRDKKYKDLNVLDVMKTKPKADKTALGGMFKESFITEGLNDGVNKLINRIINKFEYEYLNGDKKYQLVAYFVVVYQIKTDSGIKEIRYFNSKTIFIKSMNVIPDYVYSFFAQFDNHMETCHNFSSSVFDKFIEIKISSSKHKSLSGKSYLKLPPWIENKQCCVNMKNTDEKCFYWCLMAYLHYDNLKSKSKNETRHYKKFMSDIIEPDDVEYPVKLSDIEKWEIANDLKINILVVNEGTQDFETKYISNTFNERVVNLLLYEENERSHYVWIKNINGMFYNNKSHHTKYVCSNCLCRSFTSQEKLNEHIELKLCQTFNEEKQICTYKLPEVGKNTLQFKNHNNEFKHPFHVVADFECTLEKVNEFGSDKNTIKYQKHIQNSYGLKYNCIHSKYDEELEIFNSPDPEEVSKIFIEELERLACMSYGLLKQNKHNINMTDEQKQNHHKQRNCERCYQILADEYSKDPEDKPYMKVRHHDHITGDYIGAYCNDCNLKYQYRKFLPVYIHNLKGYDSHLFVKALYNYGYKKEDSKLDNISCIPNNEEKYISFSKKIEVDYYFDKKKGEIVPIMFEIRFLDTFSFMATSIESLAGNLRKGCKTIDEKRRAFKNVSNQFENDEEFELMISKGVYPYDFIDSYEKLNRTHLPKRKEFNSVLYNSKCSKADYIRACNVWKKFNCKTFLDYHNLYLTADVLLLADIWENFRSVCYKVYNLDCEYYYTAPGLSWDAMLKYTKVKLELLTDIAMFEFVESGIRGGLSQISHRYAKANNKYMKKYEKSKEDSYIVYLDANNLYGFAMCEYLPMKDFKWNEDNWTKEDIMKLDDKGNKGYMFKVDLSIPESLHDYFNNYVPCPDNMVIEKEYVADWMKADYKQSKIKKLCCSFLDKKDYVVNYRYLKLALSLGVELVKVSQVLEYTQKDFMKPYIILNTEMRQKAKNGFEKDFYKLMNNSVYGKTMENVRNRINFRLINTEKQALAVKNLTKYTIFNDDLVGVHIQRQEIELCKPIYLGQNILDDSKHLMYNFHYNFMLKKIDRENIDLLFTDTDSLCYHIRKQDIYEIIKENKDLFDLGNYDKNHPMFDPTNDKVMGKFKDETGGIMITEFVGLRAKLYSYQVEKEKSSHNKCKGIKTCVAKNDLTIDDYKHALDSRDNKYITQNNIRSYGHQLYTETTKKVALSCRDDKVFICRDNYKTYNHGHYKTKII